MRLIDLCSSPLEGRFCYRIYSKGQLLKSFYENNLIVTQAHTLVRNLAFGGGYALQKMALGDMNLNSTNDLVNVAAPNLSDTALINQIYIANSVRTQIAVSSRPAIRSIITLDENTANGSGQQIICEAGLFDSNLSLFARKTFPAIIKNNTLVVVFTWDVLF